MLMNFHEFRTPGVMFTGSWSYKPSRGAAEVLMSAAACLLLGCMMLLFSHNGDITADTVQQATALCLGGCLLFYFFTGYATRLILSEDGVRYGNRFYDWRRLRWIDGRLINGTHQIFIECRRGLFYTKKLTIDDGRSLEQWDRLLQKFNAHVPIPETVGIP